jgi:hypothetical protein
MKDEYMADDVDLNAAYRPSEDVVVRDIEGELVIVPLVSGVGDMDDELFTVNETGRDIWDRLDGRKTLKEVAAELSSYYDAAVEDIEKDVLGFVGELVRRKILVAVPGEQDL